MSAEVNVSVSFGSEFEGTLTSTNESTISIGPDNIRPYDMMLGALVSCFHHTFLEILIKKRLQVDNVTYRVYGKKRNAVPATLEYVRIDLSISSTGNQKDIEKAVELAKKYSTEDSSSFVNGILAKIIVEHGLKG